MQNIQEEHMKDIAMYAKYNQAANKTIYGILNEMSNDEREKDRGSYYDSLSGLLRHILGGTMFFLGLFKSPLEGNAGALKAISVMDGISFPAEGQLNETQWKEFGAVLEVIDAAYVGIAEALTDADLPLPIKVDWYGGNPASTPLSFMLSQLMVHGTHHRGQISQILDSIKVDNDYSGIGIEFMPR